ncbi:helix-turn-helix transcriptional regulator [uncultured Parabacteroides sp.]|uniref:helix-turn-helix domain-containing protein n=1 Tax=Parabacteroides segnis TaxID=2763058 RepID=UPI002594E584|nr:helix-turn-helix transcriptional regulator [uncultured Parabacteroides sp.]
MQLRIKEVLKEKKITVVSLANSVGMAQPSMSNIVNGKSTPSLETLDKIADVIGVPVTELFEQPKKESLSLTCPHCGKDINIKVE